MSRALAVVLLVAAPAHAQSPPPNSPPRPNVLVVSLDTTRADALSCYGANAEHGVVTPNLLRLANEGVVFESAFSPTPLTLPSHCTLLTGLDPPRHSVSDNSAYTLPADATTLAELLRDAGWRTFGAVSTVVLLPRFGLDQGFASYDARGLSIERDGAHARKADATVDAVLPQIAGSEPFFGFVHFYDAHRPYAPPPELEKQFGDPYVAELHFLDRELGRLFDALRASGQLDRTVVVVTADHGESRGEHGESSHGELLHDATQHVPLIVRGPKLGPRRVGGVVATLADVTPTLLELAGVTAPRGLDGRSLAPLLRGAASDGGEPLEPGDAFLVTLLPNRAFDFAPLYGVRTLEWKLVLGARPHLWHVADDPKELHDVADAHADVVAGLTRRLVHLRDERGPKLATVEQPMSESDLKVLGGLGYVATGDSNAIGDASTLPDPVDHSDDVETISRATELAEAGRNDETIALLEPLARRYPRSAHVRETLGGCLGRRGDHARALDELLAAAALRPRSPELRVQVALAAYFCKRGELVRSNLEEATQMRRCPPRAYLMLAELLVQARDSAGARTVLTRLLARDDLSKDDRAQAESFARALGH
jgi:arylsulfatase A-like enzyme